MLRGDPSLYYRNTPLLSPSPEVPIKHFPHAVFMQDAFIVIIYDKIILFELDFALRAGFVVPMHKSPLQNH